MARAFAKIAFTPRVQALQSQMGSRAAYRGAETGADEVVALSPFEIEFIAARDSFYLGSVGENGWPYVQHRGGSAGFLKVLGPRTIGFADFSGNRQYISVGNLSGDNRVSLFLMDYPGQRRLKIWGRARLVDEAVEPELIARLESPHYRAPIERGVVITVEAFDWNCPKYITPRFTEDEIRAVLASEDTPASARTAAAPPPQQTIEIGRGPLKLAVTGIRQMTPRVRAYELHAPDGGDLPEVSAGAHLAVPVQLPGGAIVTRQYSITSHPRRRDLYEIAVLAEDDGRGGSVALHATWQLGTRLALDRPANQFPLHADHRPAVLIAGGIGITPLRAMAQELASRGTPFALHYSGRTPADMAYREQLALDFPKVVHLYATRTGTAARIDSRAIMQGALDEAVFYVCGPTALIAAVKAAARELGLDAGRVQVESFV